MNKQQFWNDGYKQGFDYRQLSDDEVKAFLSQAEGQVVTALDLGCGTGQLCRQLSSQGLKVSGIDISDEAIKQAKAASPDSIGFKVMDFEEDDLLSLGKVDLVTMKLVLAFIKDRTALLEKIACILNPNGWLVIINPVITDEKGAPERLKKISVPDATTRQLIDKGFELVGQTAKPLSEHHELVTYIAKKSG